MAELLPVVVSVTPEGVAEDWLLRALELTRAQVYPLHGDIIGAPRHYAYCRHGRHGQAPGYYYTADGVRALADHFGLQVEVQTMAAGTVPAAHHSPAFWWQKENP